MARTLEDIDADIAKYTAALDDALLGKAPSRMKHGDREVAFEGGTTDRETALRRRLFELRSERARLTGDPAPGRPIYL